MTKGSLKRFFTLLELRVLVATRIVAGRGIGARIINFGTPLVVAWLLGLTFASLRQSADLVDPLYQVGFSMGFFAIAHVVLTFDLLASAGRNEGMAGALHSYPLSPVLIHLAESLVGVFSPLLLFIWTIFLSFSYGLSTDWLGPLLWSLLALVYLAFLRRLLLLLLTSVLRKRWQRELALALLSTGGFVLWFGLNISLVNWNYMNLYRWASELPEAFWYTPLGWFSVPFCDYEQIGLGPRVMAVVGAPLQVLAVGILGVELQRRANLGELEAGGILAGRHRRRRLVRLWDRRPFSWLQPSVWATALKEVKVLRRDPIFIVMMISQSLLLLLPPLLFIEISPTRGPGFGKAYLPLFVPLLLVGEHLPLFSQIAMDGRGLRFLAQTPASPVSILLGKNLAYLLLFTGLNASALALAAALLSAWDSYLLYLALSVVGLLILMAVGNLVSVLFPVPWTGPRAMAGGARAAQAAAEGGVERAGCLVSLARLILLQIALVLFLPAFYPTLALGLLASQSAAWAALPGAMAYAALVYLLGTVVAARLLEDRRDQLIDRLAGRAAS